VPHYLYHQVHGQTLDTTNPVHNKHDHCNYLCKVLQCLQDNFLVVNKEKSKFGQRRIVFLGHVVTAGGVAPLPDRV
jgi:hypothetical protein